jgi:endoglucanase Acf2
MGRQPLGLHLRQNQESSSESLNFATSLILYGQATDL